MLKKILCILSFGSVTFLPHEGKTQIINTTAGGFNGDGLGALTIGFKPKGQVVDAEGNIYITATDRHVVMKLSASGIYTTFAGTGLTGFSGDGGKATAAQLRNPWKVAIDKAGNVFIADNLDNRIRKVTPDGIITTVAGNGLPGFSGDGGPAVSAKLNGPTDIVADSLGNVYIADYVNRRVRKVAANGIITTIAGNGSAGTGGDGGLAKSAQFGFVSAIDINAVGEIFIADNTYNKVRKVSVAGIITSVAGNGKSGFSGDGGLATIATFNAINSVAVDRLGNIFIADTYNNRIRKVNAAGIVTTVAGNGGTALSGDGGPATSAQIYRPSSVTLDAAGNILTSSGFHIRKVTASTGIISAITGNGSGGYCGDGGSITKAQIYHPVGIATDRAENVYLVDRENHRIRKITKGGIITTVAGNGKAGFSGDGKPATTAQLNFPSSVALDATGNLYIADGSNARIRKVDVNGIITTVAGTGTMGFSGDGPALKVKLSGPDGLTVDDSGSIIFADQFNHRVRKLTTAGTIVTIAGSGVKGFGGDGGPALQAALNWPRDVKIDKAGNIFIADRNNYRVRKVSTTGIITTVAGRGARAFSGDGGKAVLAGLDPAAIALDSLGILYIADSENDCIRKVSDSGIISTFAGRGRTYGDGGLASAAQLRTPMSIRINEAGHLLLAEYDNQRIRIIYQKDSVSMMMRNNPINTISPAMSVKFNVYPNPAQHTLNIQTSDAEGLLKVEVIDAAGRIQLSQLISSTQANLQLKIQKLTPGIYFIRTTDKHNRVITKEFLKR